MLINLLKSWRQETKAVQCAVLLTTRYTIRLQLQKILSTLKKITILDKKMKSTGQNSGYQDLRITREYELNLINEQ